MLNDPADVDRARVLYDKGTNRRAFLLGQVDKYSWQRHRLVVRAVRRAGGLPARPARAARRRSRPSAARVYERYAEALAPHADELGLAAAGRAGATASPAYHMFYVLLPDHETRDPVHGADARGGRPADLPLRAAAQLRRRADGSRRGTTECPVTDDISGRLLRLPFHNNLTAEPTPSGSSTRSCVGRAVGRRGLMRRASPQHGLVVARPARTTGGTAPAPTCCEAALGELPRRAAPAARRRQRRRAERRRGCAARTSASRSTSTPAGSSPGEGVLRLGAGAAVRATGPSTSSAPSTSSSTASPRRRRVAELRAGAARPAAGCCCRCRPTSGPGPTTTSGPATTAATPAPRLRARGRGRRPRRCCARRTPSPAVFPFFAAERVARAAAAARRGAGAAGRCRRSRRSLDRVLTGLSPRRGAGAAHGATCRSARRCSWPPSKPARLTPAGAGASGQPASRGRAAGPPRAPAGRTPPPRPRGTPSRSARAPARPRQHESATTDAGHQRHQPGPDQRAGAALREHHQRDHQVGHRDRARRRPAAACGPRGSVTSPPKTSRSSTGPSSAPTSAAPAPRPAVQRHQPAPHPAQRAGVALVTTSG